MEIYPGFPAHDLIIENGEVKGVITGDLGVAKDGHHKPDYTPGMELRGKYTLFAEGARGSLSKMLMPAIRPAKTAAIRRNSASALKELWELTPGQAQEGPGAAQLWAGRWTNDTGGGLFMYHWGENFCSIGFVVHLNYCNPYLDPVRRIPARQDPSRDPRNISKAASASAMARAPSPKAAFSRCRSWPFPAAR